MHSFQTQYEITKNSPMKRLFRTSLPLILIPSLFIACNSKGSTDCNVDTQDTTITRPLLEDTKKSDMNQIVAEERSEYRGNLIVEYDNIKVYADYGLSEEDYKYGDDITAKDETYLIRYVDEIPKDTMVLKGPYNSLLGKSRLCQITVGIDTVNVDISKPFKKFIDLRFIGVIPGCHFYRFSKHYTLNDHSFPTDFQINIAIHEDVSGHIKNFINETIRDDVARYFADYSGDKTIYPHVPLFNIEDGDFNQLSRYYYTQFCRLYKNENSDESDPEEIPLGPHYSYQFYAYPIWENSDSTLITWKFYDYCYLGGAHGGETEYFLTFDNNTSRILGVDDFYANDEFKKAIDLLRSQLNAYHNRGVSNEYSYSADLNIDSNVTAVQSTTLNEVIDGKLYPRPALIRQGIVYTYQTYEKGSNADGILHFTQPYKNQTTILLTKD